MDQVVPTKSSDSRSGPTLHATEAHASFWRWYCSTLVLETPLSVSRWLCVCGSPVLALCEMFLFACARTTSGRSFFSQLPAAKPDGRHRTEAALPQDENPHSTLLAPEIRTFNPAWNLFHLSPSASASLFKILESILSAEGWRNPRTDVAAQRQPGTTQEKGLTRTSLSGEGKQPAGVVRRCQSHTQCIAKSGGAGDGRGKG